MADSEPALSPRHRRWLEDVAVLISEEERELFLTLSADYRRDQLIEAFWSIRDPDPRTPVNEMKRRFEELQAAGSELAGDDARLLVYLLNGPPGGWSLPNGRAVARCYARTSELEIWFYGGSELTERRFAIVFQKRGQEVPYRVWRPGEPLRPVQRTSLPTTDVSQLCADELFRYANGENSRISDYDRLLERVTTPPAPPPEWLASLDLGATDVPEGAETFDVDTRIQYPARRQSRTAVEVSVRIPKEASPSREFDGTPFHHFLLAGEILLDQELFESFRYRFEGPTPPDFEELPLGFTRHLRPGEYTLRLLIEDVFGERYAQVVRQLEVPRPDGLPEHEPERTLADVTGGGEALELLTPGGNVQVGLVRFTARAGRQLDRVAFFLDGQQVLAKRTPPYSVELDLGQTPAAHRVRVVGYVGDQEVATDQIWLNQGVQRFRVRFVEPRPGGIYPGSVGARLEVETPDGQPPQRVDLFVDDQLVGGLTQPPYAAGLRLPPDRAAVIRAVAHLADGSTAEDAVIVNTAGLVEQVEVELVELLIAVTDRSGEPVRDLASSEVRVYENGEAQAVRRFAPAAEEPLHAGLLIDRSASMEGALPTVTEAAAILAAELLRSEEDRVAVLSFADGTVVDRPFTARLSEIERALAGLTPGGRTALWDAITQALNDFEGVGGARALVLFTDGLDETSRLTFEQANATARAAMVPIYVVAPATAFERTAERRPLEQLAEVSGGLALFPDRPELVGEVFDRIREELRSRYLVVYQRDEPREEGEPVDIRIEVDREDSQVRTGRSRDR
ncbi:MAG TPA: VWA domain-containing protein [Thermoanaerobaculia bacterium]|nr:VWA domain-containing protein [Thermoanaerobaculia bacterium]